MSEKKENCFITVLFSPWTKLLTSFSCKNIIFCFDPYGICSVPRFLLPYCSARYLTSGTLPAPPLRLLFVSLDAGFWLFMAPRSFGFEWMQKVLLYGGKTTPQVSSCLFPVSRMDSTLGLVPLKLDIFGWWPSTAGSAIVSSDYESLKHVARNCTG